MANYGLLVLLVAPFVVPSLLAWMKSRIVQSMLWVFGGSLGGGMLMPILGTIWLQIFYRGQMASQGGGIAYLVILLPFFIYSGLVTGAWAMALSYEMRPRTASVTASQVFVWLSSILIGSVLPGMLLWILGSLRGRSQDNITGLIIIAIINGIVSAGLASRIIGLIGGQQR